MTSTLGPAVAEFHAARLLTGEQLEVPREEINQTYTRVAAQNFGQDAAAMDAAERLEMEGEVSLSGTVPISEFNERFDLELPQDLEPFALDRLRGGERAAIETRVHGPLRRHLDAVDEASVRTETHGVLRLTGFRDRDELRLRLARDGVVDHVRFQNLIRIHVCRLFSGYVSQLISCLYGTIYIQYNEKVHPFAISRME